MSANKTVENDLSVDAFISQIANESKRTDAIALLRLISKLTRSEPKMWGDSIVGFGRYHYKYKTGREGDWFRCGFSPRKASFSIYIMPDLEECSKLLANLGKHKTGVCCLYVNKLADIDLQILEKIISASLKRLSKIFP